MLISLLLVLDILLLCILFSNELIKVSSNELIVLLKILFLLMYYLFFICKNMSFLIKIRGSTFKYL